MPRLTFTTALVLAYVLIILSSVSFSPFIHAQTFRPFATEIPSSTFVEGQGFYIFGGAKDQDQSAISQAFMIDLSVSWNTSDPPFKKLTDGPGAVLSPCMVLPNGEDIFLLVLGMGNIYNIKSDSWTTILHNQLPISVGMAGAVDPESGLVYIAQGPTNATSKGMVLTLDPKAPTFNTTVMPDLKLSPIGFAAWSVPLKSMLLDSVFMDELYTFTPSKVSGTSHGWSFLNTTGDEPLANLAPCFVSAYGGSKIAMFTGLDTSAVHILDVATRAWTVGPSIPYLARSACAVSGDQFIVWGGRNNETTSGKTLVYNMKTNKWISRYTAPSPLPTTSASLTLQASQTPTHNSPYPITTPNSRETSSSDETKLIVIIVVVTGVLVVMMVTAIFVYLRRTRRLNSSNDSSEFKGDVGSSGDEVPFKRPPRSRDPSYLVCDSTDTIQDSYDGHKRYASAKSGRLHQGSLGTRPDPEHPHAILTSATIRNVQEGSFKTLPIVHHPHSIVQGEVIAMYSLEPNK
jgi:hypothetical protein